MSSIFGAWDLKGKYNLKEESEKANEITGWWKPDSEWLFHEPGIYLGQQNLHSFIEADLESPQIFSHPSKLIIVSDARLDNRQELISLLNLNHNPSNSELILELYIKFNSKCLQHLLGAFSFAIWDKKNKLFFCARDPIGIKPLNYYFKNGLFVIGTQKKSITFLDQCNKDADWRNIFNSISSLGVPPSSTNYLHIKHVDPGHYIEVKDNKLSITKYHFFENKERLIYKNDEDYVQHFKEILDSAISCRMNSLNTIGTHLSGGLDSSGISAMALDIGKKSNKDVLFFSYNLPEDFELQNPEHYSENLMAYKLLDHLDARDNFRLIFNMAKLSFRQTVNIEVTTCDGISQSNNVRTEYEIQGAANHNNVQVMLSGFLGDELATSFCRPYYLEYLERHNYIKYFFSKMHSRHKLKEKTQAFFAANFARVFPIFSSSIAKFYNHKRYSSKNYSAKSEFINPNFFIDSNRAQLLNPEAYGFAHPKFPTSLTEYQINHLTRPHTSRRIESEQLSGLGWKVNYRYPFSDLRLVKFLLSIPMEQKISKDMNRLIFRRAMKGILPEDLRLRDNKIAGSLKPAAAFYGKTKGRNLKPYMKKLLEDSSTDFINKEKINDHLENE